ncbi:MAG: hypothetical protein IT210_03825 [Armatimonadetes bacterium]|nr:hypothetical protein [Armatimonadota bacterium]
MKQALFLALSLWTCIPAVSQEASMIDVSSRQPGHVFTDRERVRFTLKTSPERSLTVTVRDYEGTQMLSRALTAQPSGAALDLGRLPTGYYVLTLEAQEISFAVVPSAARRYRAEDSPLATDGAISWLVSPEQFRGTAQLMKRAGLLWVRDRMSWGEAQPERGAFRWGKYEQSADAQSGAGLKVYQIFHDTAPWARADRDGKRYPDDLRDAYRFGFEAARHFKGRISAWEIWNESDISVFSPEPADPYAAFFKAASLGFKAADPDVKILMVSMALGADRFTDALFENGIAPYMDIYNWHVYDAPQNYRARAEGHFRMMARHNISSPNWLTEAGIHLKEVDGGLTGTDQKRQAEFVPKSFTHSLASGVDKHFFFVFPYYLENGIDFGVLHRDLTPYPGYVALSATTYALGKGRCQGRIEIPGVSAFVFDNGQGQTVVLWSEEENEVSLNINARQARLVNVVGKESKLPVEGKRLRIRATASPVFVILPPDALRETVTPPAVKPPSVTRTPKPAHKEIVARLVFPNERMDKPSESYICPAGQEIEVALDAYNFGDKPFEGELQAVLPSGWEISGLPQTVRLEPMGRLQQPVRLKAGQTGEDRLPLRLRVSGPKGEASPFVAYVQGKS